MSERPLRADGNLAVAVAAWMVLLHHRGLQPRDADLAEAVSAVTDEASGRALVERVAGLVDGHGPDDVLAFARLQYGDAVVDDLGAGERDARVRRIRRFEFTQNTPWLARIYERHGDVVQPTWLLVGRVTDEVLAMDPDPWDGVEEERHLPLGDFMVLWELDRCTAIGARTC